MPCVNMCLRLPLSVNKSSRLSQSHGLLTHTLSPTARSLIHHTFTSVFVSLQKWLPGPADSVLILDQTQWKGKKKVVLCFWLLASKTTTLPLLSIYVRTTPQFLNISNGLFLHFALLPVTYFSLSSSPSETLISTVSFFNHPTFCLTLFSLILWLIWSIFFTHSHAVFTPKVIEARKK